MLPDGSTTVFMPNVLVRINICECLSLKIALACAQRKEPQLAGISDDSELWPSRQSTYHTVRLVQNEVRPNDV
jgi:hypothetical protein